MVRETVVEKTEGKYPCTMDDPFGEGPARFNKMKAPEPPEGSVNLPHVVRDSSYGETPPLAPHVLRMKEEVEGLVSRLQKLSKFIDTQPFNGLPELDQRLLREQRNSMIEFGRTLCLRYMMASLPE